MPLPLEDKKEDDVVKPAGEEQREAAAQPAGQGAVAKTLQALMGEFEESPAAESSPKPRSKTKTKKAMKKPAASAAVPVLKIKAFFSTSLCTSGSTSPCSFYGKHAWVSSRGRNS